MPKTNQRSGRVPRVKYRHASRAVTCRPACLPFAAPRRREQVSTVVEEGKMFAKTASGLVEVVSVSSAELARLPYDLAEGIYVVGTGSTGAAAALGVSGEPMLPFLLFLDTQQGFGPYVARPLSLVSAFFLCWGREREERTGCRYVGDKS